MPNPLEVGGSPVAPQPEQTQQQNPLQVGGGQPQPGMPATSQQPPAPSHQQTVAALRHFGAIKNEVQELLQNPNLGKSDIKSQIIDGVTKLVAGRIITPAQAVIQLAGVPDDPLQQRKWLTQQMATTLQAQNKILEDHASNPNGAQGADIPSNPDDHMNVMSGLMSHYQGAGRG